MNDQSVQAVFRYLNIQVPELGHGTFKVAYKASFDGQDAVLKILKEPLPEDENEEPTTGSLPLRVQRELEAMALVDSPRVVTILDGPHVTTIEGEKHVYYLEPLYHSLLIDKLGSPWQWRKAGAICLGLLEGAAILAEHGLVHRDIKPANIALDENGAPVLLDLGIVLDTSATPLTESHAHSPLTPQYAAPEQFAIKRLAPVDHRTDLFPIGIVTFEAYTGTHPFRIESEEWLDRLLAGKPDLDLLNAQPNAEEFKTILRRLLGRSPNQRYRSAAKAAEALKEILE